MTTTRSTFDAAFASRNMKLTRRTTKRNVYNVDQVHYLETLPRQIGVYYGLFVCAFSGLMVLTSYAVVNLNWSILLFASPPLAGAAVYSIAAAKAADRAHNEWLQYATSGDTVEETAEPLERPEAAETVQPNFVETRRADGRHIIPVNYNFTRPQIAWLASVAVAGESFPARDRAFKDSGVWTNYTKTFTDVRDALTNCDALDSNGRWTPEGVRMIRDTKARLNNV